MNNAILIAASLASFSWSCTVQEKPNVVIFLADDMGWGDLGVNGNPFAKTPVLDRLKSESISFDRFYVCPLSAPTRAQMLTGRYFLRTGVSSVTMGYENMRSDEYTMAEAFRDAGYITGCFGKWHNGAYYMQHPNRQGFDEFTGFCMGHLGYYFDMEFVHNDAVIKSAGYTTDFFTDMALDFIKRNKSRPFLCYVPYNVPHSPFQVPREYFEEYLSAGLDSTLASVYGMVGNMDYNIGRVLGSLEENGIAGNTIVIFLSDNGPNTSRYNGEMKGRKGSVDEGGVRVPFYMRWPGKIKPSVSQQLAADIDILPTLSSLCKIDFKPVKDIDGLDLSEIVKGRRDPFERSVFSRQANQNLEGCNSSMRNGNYRLVREKERFLLFDMIKDPSQKSDIYSIRKETGDSMRKKLEAWEKKLLSEYVPCTTIRAGFSKERSFTLPVQDAKLSGKIRYSSIHPNQSHTENWTEAGDSIYWTLDIDSPGNYKVEMQYGCNKGETGSRFSLKSAYGALDFTIDQPFESIILPERDYVKRSESVERTWNWMTLGSISLRPGPGVISLSLVEPERKEAGLIRAIRFVRLEN